MSIFALALSLFFVLNPIGNIPFLIGLLGKFDAKKQRRIIFREMLIALGILLLFNYFGEAILGLFGISQPIIGIAGGTILFLISLGMIFPKKENGYLTRQEPMIVPIAIPMVAGPGAMTTVMVYAEQTQNPWALTLVILIAWIPCLFLLMAASNIKFLLGSKGLKACERLGGMIICLIAVKMFTSGFLTLCPAMTK